MMMLNDSDEDDVGKVAITMCADHQGRGQPDAYVRQGAAPYGATYMIEDDDHDDSRFFFLIQLKNSLNYATYMIGDDDDDEDGADDDDDEDGIVM